MMNGKKTYAGIGMWLFGTLGATLFPQYAAIAEVVTVIGQGLGLSGAAHKLAKASPTAPVQEKSEGGET